MSIYTSNNNNNHSEPKVVDNSPQGQMDRAIAYAKKDYSIVMKTFRQMGITEEQVPAQNIVDSLIAVKLTQIKEAAARALERSANDPFAKYEPQVQQPSIVSQTTIQPAQAEPIAQAQPIPMAKAVPQARPEPVQPPAEDLPLNPTQTVTIPEPVTL